MNGHHSKLDSSGRPRLRLVTDKAAQQTKPRDKTLDHGGDAKSGKAQDLSGAVVIQLVRGIDRNAGARHPARQLDKAVDAETAGYASEPIAASGNFARLLASKVRTLFARHRQKRRQILATRELARLDSHLLRDIGLKPQDIWARVAPCREHDHD